MIDAIPKRKPKILIDTRESDETLISYLKSDANDIDIETKSGGSGDYIIIDRNGNQWGIERKAFMDCYSSIITKEKDGSGRIYGQLTQLIAEFDGRAIFLLEHWTYIPKSINAPKWKVHQTVLTFFSERSLIMPTFMTTDKRHTAYLIKKLARHIHETKISGRGYKITLTKNEERK